MENSPEFILTAKTHVERKLVLSTAVDSATFYLLILWFMFGVFYWDIEDKWFYDTKAGFFNELPRMSEEAKKQAQLKEVVSRMPVMYSCLYKHWQYFSIEIPLCTLLVGGILSFYRSVTITVLGLYHFVFAMFTLNLVLLSTLAMIIANTPFIIRSL